ncbi:hypothetical protein GCM10012275_64150 [Longimycelium tulufanense]|uniref:Uncharacterized protein n=1 Tax=Longimycelium tulufanense TaxID=907463 RepID=A0A8J3CKX7_9PSEU|nr:hypothetical protein GCM10012275_64150 [Longimycelium tulufanense]
MGNRDWGFPRDIARPQLPFRRTAVTIAVPAEWRAEHSRPTSPNRTLDTTRTSSATGNPEGQLISELLPKTRHNPGVAMRDARHLQ